MFDWGAEAGSDNGSSPSDSSSSPSGDERGTAAGVGDTTGTERVLIKSSTLASVAAAADADGVANAFSVSLDRVLGVAGAGAIGLLAPAALAQRPSAEMLRIDKAARRHGGDAEFGGNRMQPLALGQIVEALVQFSKKRIVRSA